MTTNSHWVLVVMGLPGTGKSTLAHRLAEELSAELLSSDAIRVELDLRGDYSPAARGRVYRTMEGRMLALLQQGRPVILDATFSEPVWQRELQTLLTAHGIHARWVLCEASLEVLTGRLSRQRPLSDANMAVHQLLARHFSPEVSFLLLDTTQGRPEELARQVLDWLRPCDPPKPASIGMDPILLDQLRHGALETGDRVMPLIETHLSWVLLGEKQAYKFKKPVDFPWLDARNLEQRRFLCEQELAANKQFSPEVYLDVLPLRQSGMKVFLGPGPGTIVEWAVVMKKLDRTRQLDQLLDRGDLHLEELGPLASHLAHMHEEAARVAQRFDSQQQQLLFADLLSLKKLPGLSAWWKDLISYAVDFSEAFLLANRAQFQMRSDDGWVRELHGDLHAGNVFLTDPPVLFDCLEFHDSWRQIDVLDELAFLTMDIEAHGRPDAASQLMEGYLQRIPGAMKREDWPLFWYYQAYRANVRAKVQGLRLLQPGLSDTQRRMHQELLEAYLNMLEQRMALIKEPGVLAHL